MATYREYFGDDKINALLGVGFDKAQVKSMLNQIYYNEQNQKRKSLADSGLSPKMVQSVMRGELSKDEARFVDRIDNGVLPSSINRFALGAGEAVLETTEGLLKGADWVANLADPSRKRAMQNQEWQNDGVKWLDEKRKTIKSYRNAWHKAHPDEHDIAGFAGDFVGGVVDPINAVPIGRAWSMGKKIAALAGTGAASGAISAYGGDRNIAAGAAFGAGGAMVIGGAIEGLAKLWAKRGVKTQVNEAGTSTNEINTNEPSPNFTINEAGEIKQDISASFNAKEYLDNLGLNEPLKVNLTHLMQEHPELFKDEKEVFRTISQILDNPSFKFKNNIDGLSDIVASKLEKDKFGNLIYRQSDSEIVHLNKGRASNLQRLQRQNEQRLASGRHAPLAQPLRPAPGELVLNSVDEIIPQNSKDFTNFAEYAKLILKDYDDLTKQQVLSDILAGKENSVINGEHYGDLREFVKLAKELYAQKAKDELITQLKDTQGYSANATLEIKKLAQSIIKDDKNASPEMIRQIINSKIKPSEAELMVSNLINDGASVEPRFTGYRIIYALEAEIKQGTKSPDELGIKLKQAGFSDESTEAFIKAYASGDINIAKEFVGAKANAFLEQKANQALGFELKQASKALSNVEHKFNVNEWISANAGVLSDEWAANLSKLASKHPEMFKSEADVFRAIRQIKDNPTHFLKNNRPDYALLGKDLKDGKFGVLGVDKQDGEITHITKRSEKNKERLLQRNKNEINSGDLVLAGGGEPFPHSSQKLDSSGDVSHSANPKTISQSEAKVKLEIDPLETPRALSNQPEVVPNARFYLENDLKTVIKQMAIEKEGKEDTIAANIKYALQNDKRLQASRGKLARLEKEYEQISKDNPARGHGGTPHITDNAKGRANYERMKKYNERSLKKFEEIEQQKEKIERLQNKIENRYFYRKNVTATAKEQISKAPVNEGLLIMAERNELQQWKTNPHIFFIPELKKVAIVTYPSGKMGYAGGFWPKTEADKQVLERYIDRARELTPAKTKDELEFEISELEAGLKALESRFKADKKQLSEKYVESIAKEAAPNIRLDYKKDFLVPRKQLISNYKVKLEQLKTELSELNLKEQSDEIHANGDDRAIKGAFRDEQGTGDNAELGINRASEQIENTSGQGSSAERSDEQSIPQARSDTLGSSKMERVPDEPSQMDRHSTAAGDERGANRAGDEPMVSEQAKQDRASTEASVRQEISEAVSDLSNVKFESFKARAKEASIKNIHKTIWQSEPKEIKGYERAALAEPDVLKAREIRVKGELETKRAEMAELQNQIQSKADIKPEMLKRAKELENDIKQLEAKLDEDGNVKSPFSLC